MRSFVVCECRFGARRPPPHRRRVLETVDEGVHQPFQYRVHQQKEQRGERHHDEYHDGGDDDLLAAGPGDARRLLPHLADELHHVDFRHAVPTPDVRSGHECRGRKRRSRPGAPDMPHPPPASAAEGPAEARPAGKRKPGAQTQPAIWHPERIPAPVLAAMISPILHPAQGHERQKSCQPRMPPLRATHDTGVGLWVLGIGAQAMKKWQGRRDSNPLLSLDKSFALTRKHFCPQMRFGRLDAKKPERRKWQGRRDSNPRPAVLETAALPTELHPCTRRNHPRTAMI